nr:estradiol 17 beta dehydrogenase 12 [Hymenolepis microstoma]
MVGFLLLGAFIPILLYIIWPILVYFVFRIFFGRGSDLLKAGEWAVITGATDGIGKAFAELLAKKGLNIFLISRSQDKLQAVASEIETKYNVKTKFFVADFGLESLPYDHLMSEINSLPSISCLINNVGLSYTYPDALATSTMLTPEFCEKLIRINIITLTKLTRMILPKLINDPLQTQGVNRYVINMSSLSGVVVCPYLTVYGATKAYVSSFTQGLAVELRDTCVRVQAFTPSLVSTNMSGIKRTSMSIPSADTFAKSAFSMIGVETVGCGYFLHSFRLHLATALPTCLVSNYLGGEMLKMRERYLRKQKAN